MRDSAAATVAAGIRDPTLTDGEVVRRVIAGERALFEILMRRHNPRVYRAIRAILRDEAEVEDAMQQSYLLAFSHLAEFAGASSFATWITRIALNEALGRVRRRARVVALRPEQGNEEDAPMTHDDPETATAGREAARMLEACIDRLPEAHRTVIVLRDLEQLPTPEIAEVLGVTDEAVRVRLHRARRALRALFLDEANRGAAEAFPFHAPRCDRVVARVMAAIGER